MTEKKPPALVVLPVLALFWIVSLAGCYSMAEVELIAERTYREIVQQAEPLPMPAPAPAPSRLQHHAALAMLGGVSALAPEDERSFVSIIKSDIRAIPSGLAKGFKDTYTPTNTAILLIGAGLDYWAARSWDSDTEDFIRDHRKYRERGDFGEVAGHPGLHFALASAAYLTSIKRGDEKTYEISKTMIQALAVNGISTVALKVITHVEGPDDDPIIWPSGHTSSSFTFAAVLDEYYGHKIGLPAYVLAGYIGVTRVTDHKHWVSDVLYGALLGYVVGKSVSKGRMPEVAGFTIVPYRDAARGGVGVALVKAF